MKDKNNDIIKEGQGESGGTQSVYRDSRGRRFSAQDIVQGYKPKKPYKLETLSKQVSEKSFGKVKPRKN